MHAHRKVVTAREPLQRQAAREPYSAGHHSVRYQTCASVTSVTKHARPLRNMRVRYARYATCASVTLVTQRARPLRPLRNMRVRYQT